MNIALQSKDNVLFEKLYIAFELSNQKWKLGFSNGLKRRIRTINARDWDSLKEELDLAKNKLFCADDCKVISCYEAGRDGFWIHRALLNEGINNFVIDSSSIEVSRKGRRAKTDNIDVVGMLRLLLRFDGGEKEALRVLKVPTIEEEDSRRLSRERDRLLREKNGHNNRLKALLALHGILADKVTDIPVLLKNAKACVINYELPADFKAELKREFARYQLVVKQIKQVEKLRSRRLKANKQPFFEKMNRLMQLKGVGTESSNITVAEFFGWRKFKNRKQVASCAGLTPTPYDSGDSTREQGINKAGNRRIRTIMVELSWLWLRYQPESVLSKWFESRFGNGGKRMRRIGIVAMARKLLIALWRYLEEGLVPKGAAMV